MKTKKKKESSFMFLAAALFAKLLLFFAGGLVIRFDPKVKQWKKKKKAFVMLSTHPSEIDAPILLAAMYPRAGNIVAGAQQLHDGTARGWLFRKINCIPKMQFVPDLNAIRAMFEAIKSGHILGFMPEGRISKDGATSYFDISTAKLIKKLGVPVAVSKPRGTYFVMNAYSNSKIYLGKLYADVFPIIDEGEAKSLTEQEIHERLKKALAYDECALITDKTRFGKRRGPHMLGVSNIFYYCPVCGKERTVSDNGDTICCSACGTKSKLTRGQLMEPLESPLGSSFPTTTSVWGRLQVEREMEKWRQKPNRDLNFPVRRAERELTSDKPFEEVSTGTLSLTKDRLLYTDDKDGLTIEVPTSVLNGLSADYDLNYIVLYQGAVNRRIYLPCNHDVAKLMDCITALKLIQEANQ